MHPEQLVVTADVVERLVADQFPGWAHLPVRDLGATGTVNALFRLGEHLAARFPLQPLDVAAARRWLRAEADAAHELHGRTPVPTPRPVTLGEPGTATRCPGRCRRGSRASPPTPTW